MDTLFKVEQVGPYVSVQDTGRRGYQRFGVTGSGPMDRAGHALSNSALGNLINRPVLEISLGGLSLACQEGEVTVAVAGGSFALLLDGTPQAPWSVMTLSAGSTLQIRPGAWGSWCYLAFAGDIDSPAWLGSQSMHLNSGLCGQPLVQGESLRVHNCTVLPELPGALPDLSSLQPDGSVTVVLGPQDRFFDSDSVADLCHSEFELTPDFNRMGVRLKGPSLKINTALTMPSEAIARGSLQVPGHGDPICLLADHQTTGGYPKIATVISVDQDRLAQMRAGDKVSFTAVEPAQAIAAARTRADELSKLIKLVKQGRSGLTERLWNSNLISGIIDGKYELK